MEIECNSAVLLTWLVPVTGNGTSLPLKWMHLKECEEWYLQEEGCGFRILKELMLLENAFT